MTSGPLPQNELDVVMKDIIDIRSNPKTMVERFNIVLYSLKGFKKNEATVAFIESFIEELQIMEPLPKIQIDPFLGMVAQKVLDASEKRKITPDKIPVDELNLIVKPFMKNHGQIRVIYDTHSSGAKFLTKIILKEDPKGHGFDNPLLEILFDESLTKLGSAGRMIGRTGHYLILAVEKYEKIEKRSDLTDEEFSEFKRIFKLFDIDDNGTLTPKEFDEIVNKPGVRASWPLISVFQKLLFVNDSEGASLDDFIDTCLSFGVFDSEDVIRRIFNLYRDDIENDTLSLTGLKRIVNDLEIEPYKSEVNLLHRFAYDKNTSATYKEFRDFIRTGIKNKTIVVPSKF
jgi:Ca2+-binding EF-hand superfamily protein